MSTDDCKRIRNANELDSRAASVGVVFSPQKLVHVLCESIARQVYNSFPDDREVRRKEWERMTGGKSERGLYRRASELGLDAPQKYLSLDDFIENQAEDQAPEQPS